MEPNKSCEKCGKAAVLADEGRFFCAECFIVEMANDADDYNY